MPELFGNAIWSGCDDLISCTYTFGHGIAPGVATLVLDERNARMAATYGDLKISDGTNELILKDCKVSDVSFVGQGRYSLSILDRRWKWAFTTIHGQYNQRDRKNQLIPWQRQPLDNLVTLCQQAMGEQANIGDIPNLTNDDDLPAVDWVYTNAAQALTELVEAFGCRVVFRPFENDVTIKKLGDGAALPDLDCESFTPAIDLPEKPSRVALVGAEVAYTCAFALEAVGIEPWGEIKPIDELSYAPTDGWGVSPPPYFPNLTVPDINPGVGIFFPGIKIARLTRAEYIALAKTCVFKWYRITLRPLQGGAFKQPSLDGRVFIRIEDFKLLNGIYTTRRDNEGVIIIDPPRVHGIFNRGAANYWTNTDKTESITEGISLDPDRGLVKFNRYMFRLNPSTSSIAAQLAGGLVSNPVAAWKVDAAELVLVCSCSARDNFNHQFDRTQRIAILEEPPKTKDRVIYREDIQLIKYAEFDPSTWQVQKIDDNGEEVTNAAGHFIDGAIKEYDVIASATRRYPGILKTNPDGAIQQITYEVGGGGAPFTTLSRNTEHAEWLPSFKTKRGGERVKVIVDILPQPAGFGRLVQLAKNQTMKGPGL